MKIRGLMASGAVARVLFIAAVTGAACGQCGVCLAQDTQGGSAQAQEEQGPIYLPPVPQARQTALKDRLLTLVVAGAQRTCRVHLPPTYDGKKLLPLVILLHGMGGSALEAETYTCFDLKSDKEGFLLACPQAGGDQDAWSVGFNTGMKDPSDIEFLSALIDRLITKFAADPCRVYIVGHSSGGMMAYRFAAERADKVTAIAVVAGTIGARDTDGKLVMIPEPSRPVSVIEFHGTRDPINPYSASDTWAYNSNFLPVAAAIRFWVKADGCSTQDHRTISKNGHIVRDGYAGGRDDTEVVLYSLVGGDHWWPGDKSSAPYISPVDEEINATNIIWDFLSRHVRKPAPISQAPKE